jgi:hypothetical protein
MARKQERLHFAHLQKKWTRRQKLLQRKLFKKHKESLSWIQDNSKQAIVGSAAGLLMMSQPTTIPVLADALLPTPPVEKPLKNVSQLMTDLTQLLPQTVEPLTPAQEKSIGTVLSSYFNMPVSAELEGKRLNRSYGLIGAEQHLTRFPGDTMATHFETPQLEFFASSGMAPGRGAWGYFADSKTAMTEKDIDREKYYIAVQTFLAPGWKGDIKGYYNFFKYRKMLVVNPENGKAVVADIGDAGPAASTGKHLGGSPEVMWYLERQDGRARGPVLYFFIDDPNDTIPLGPVTIK